MIHLYEGFGSLQEMLLPLRLRSFLMPVNDSLVRNTIRVVKDLYELREGFDDSSIGIAVHLDYVD